MATTMDMMMDMTMPMTTTIEETILQEGTETITTTTHMIIIHHMPMAISTILGTTTDGITDVHTETEDFM